MPTLKQVFSENFRRLLAERGISQSEFARRVGIHPITINAIATGKNIPSPGKLAEIAKTLGVDETDLVQVPVPIEDKWDKLAQKIEEIHPQSLIPPDILNDLKALDSSRQNSAWIMIRGIISGLKLSREKKRGI